MKMITSERSKRFIRIAHISHGQFSSVICVCEAFFDSVICLSLNVSVVLICNICISLKDAKRSRLLER